MGVLNHCFKPQTWIAKGNKRRHGLPIKDIAKVKYSQKSAQPKIIAKSNPEQPRFQLSTVNIYGDLECSIQGISSCPTICLIVVEKKIKCMCVYKQLALYPREGKKVLAGGNFSAFTPSTFSVAEIILHPKIRILTHFKIQKFSSC